MPQVTSNLEAGGSTGELAADLYESHRQSNYRRTDRVFAILMAGQWIFGMAAAVFISPRTWIGSTH